jgi:hypothetical protein
MSLARAARRLLLPASGLPTVFVAAGATGPAASSRPPVITAARLSGRDDAAAPAAADQPPAASVARISAP